jgi:cytochrome c oxidase subunit 2
MLGMFVHRPGAYLHLDRAPIGIEHHGVQRLVAVRLGPSDVVVELVGHDPVELVHNATPSRRTHNTLLEIAWTAIPVLILVVIAIPSFKLLYYEETVPEDGLTVKAIGHQWYWSYEYPDNGDFTFDAYMVADADLEPGQLRLLTTDTRVVLPVDTTVRVLITATDVLHSWAVPAFGVKMDAVPGRINETWLRIEEPGIYYGQCSELCGDYHGFMPIMIEAVSKDEFEAWTNQAQEEFARAETVDVAKR